MKHFSKNSVTGILLQLSIFTIAFILCCIAILILNSQIAYAAGAAVYPPAQAQAYPYPGSHLGSCSSGAACIPDPWRFYKRECTSYVAWRLNYEFDHLRLNRDFSNDQNGDGGIDWGSAISWDKNAPRLGFAVNNDPVIGSIAYWDYGYSGHVAYVERVNQDGTVDVSEYFSHLGGEYSFRSGVVADKYIHIYSDEIAMSYADTDYKIYGQLEDGSQLGYRSKLIGEGEAVNLAQLRLRARQGQIQLVWDGKIHNSNQVLPNTAHTSATSDHPPLQIYKKHHQFSEWDLTSSEQFNVNNVAGTTKLDTVTNFKENWELISGFLQQQEINFENQQQDINKLPEEDWQVVWQDINRPSEVGKWAWANVLEDDQPELVNIFPAADKIKMRVFKLTINQPKADHLTVEVMHEEIIGDRTDLNREVLSSEAISLVKLDNYTNTAEHSALDALLLNSNNKDMEVSEFIILPSIKEDFIDRDQFANQELPIDFQLRGILPSS